MTRRGLLAVSLAVACGGQIIEDAGDAGHDAAKASDATTDVIATFEAGVFDVTGIDDEAVPPACAIATTNLVAYFPLDGDTLDHSGHGNDATGSNLTPMAGVIDGAMHFDGTTSKLQVSSGAATLTGARTLCAWTRSKPTTGPGQPIFWGGQTNKGDFYAFFSSAPSSTTCKSTPPNVPYIDHWGTECIETSLPPITFGGWTLLCYAFDTAAIVMSVNGVENKTAGALYDYPLTTLFIGSTLGSGTTTKASFDGDIDEVSVWSKRLQPNEVQALWNGGAGCTL